MNDQDKTHELACFRTAFDVPDQLLLLLLELRPLAVELALRLRERTLVLPQPLRRGDGAPEECFLVHIRPSVCVLEGVGGSSHDDVHGRE